jgi:hypothetical protein
MVGKENTAMNMAENMEVNMVTNTATGEKEDKKGFLRNPWTKLKKRVETTSSTGRKKLT